jgi:hypothetical protein
MAKNIRINGVTYNAVPSVQVPLAGATGNATFYETSDGTMAASDLLAGQTGYTASGKITGTLTVASVSQDATSKVLTIS